MRLFQLRFHYPCFTDWCHISFCLFAGALQQCADGLAAKSAVAVRPGKIDRSPTGTAVSARMAVLHTRGMLQKGQSLIATSIIGSQFERRIADTLTLYDRTAIIPEISERAWITGTHQLMLYPEDPWPDGYRLSDTWGTK